MKRTGWMGFMPYKTTAELISASYRETPPIEIIEGLRNPTVDKFLPPKRRKVADAVEHYGEAHALHFKHYPIVDLGVPEKQLMDRIVQEIGALLREGGKAYLHCWGGRGRSGLVAACLLADLYGLSAEEALARVQRAFDTRRDGGRKSPETVEQLDFVRAYVAGTL